MSEAAFLTIAARFNGPPASGNGGYVSGLLAQALMAREGPLPAVEVTLRAPPPLDQPLTLRREVAGGLGLYQEDRLLAEAVAADLALDLPTLPDLQAAAAAGAIGRMRAAKGIGNPYLSCFGCGVGRHAEDGLRIVPSPVGDAGVVAADWTPHPALADPQGGVSAPIVWAALDCPAGIAWNYRLADAPALVTGRMTVAIDAPVPVGEPLGVIGWPIAADGRKLHAGTALYDRRGRVLARSRQLWLIPKGESRESPARGA